MEVNIEKSFDFKNGDIAMLALPFHIFMAEIETIVYFDFDEAVRLCRWYHLWHGKSLQRV